MSGFEDSAIIRGPLPLLNPTDQDNLRTRRLQSEQITEHRIEKLAEMIPGALNPLLNLNHSAGATMNETQPAFGETVSTFHHLIVLAQ